MTTSANIFVKQSNLTMPPPGWLHVNGVSLSTDVHQYQQPLHTFDHRTKHIGSPIPLSTPSMMSPPASVPFTMTMNDGQRNNRQYQKIENADLPKKLFIDRQIKKAKSLPGLIKGTALSRRTSLHSAPYINPPTNNNPEDSLPVAVNDNDDDSLPISQQLERTHETRRPRVYFADYNKVKIYEDNNEESQSNNIHRRHRHRSSKKSAALIPSNHVSPPSIQHSQSLYTPYRPLSRQQQAGYELNIKKQHLTASPRIHSSRITHLPDILNQSSSNETTIHEKYPLQREKPLVRFPDSTIEIPMNSSNEISRESTRAGGIRSSAIQDYNDQNYRLESGGDGGINTLLTSGSMSSSSTSRHRPHLRTISLRQQFNSPIKIKPTNITNNYQSITNPRRSASLKHSNTRIHSVDDDNEDLHNNNNGSLLPFENRPMTGINSSKQLKRNYVIHFNSRNGNTPIDSNESSNRHFHETSQDRFENLLKVVRPPYMTNSIAPTHEPQTTNGNVRSSRMTSRRGSREFHVASNTIFV